jgi:hypothetical protein
MMWTGREWWVHGLTFEHILALAVQYTRPRLQVLALEELGHCDGCWVGRARSDRLWLTLTSASASALLLLLLVLLLVCPLSLYLLLLDHLYELGHGDALLRGVGGELLLHHPDLLRRRLLPGLQRGRAAGTRHFACAGGL